MAVELANAYVTIVPSLKGATGQIEKELGGIDPTRPGQTIGKGLGDSVGASLNLQAVSAKFTSVGKDIVGVGSKLTKGITAPAVGAGLAVGGVVAAFGWGRLKSVDSAQAQLRGLGYSTDDVARISDNLVGALEGGMLTMGEATSAAAAGMAAGVQEGKELTRYIQLLDASVAGSTGTFDEMNQIFARVQGEGALLRNEFDMLNQRMPGFSSAVQEAMGVTQEEMNAMLTNGEVTTADFLNIMDDFAGDMATEYAKSWEGMVQNTKAYIGIIGEQLLGGVFEQSKGSIEEFLGYLQSDDVQAWAAQTGAQIGEAFSNVIGFVKDAIGWWSGLSPEMQKTVGTLGAIAIAAGPTLIVIGKISMGIGAIIGVAAKMIPIIKGATLAFKAFGLAMAANPIGLIITLVGALVGALVYFFSKTETGKKIWEGFVGFLTDSWTWIKEAFTLGWQQLSAIFSSVVEAFSTGWDQIVGFFTGVVEAFKLGWQQITGFFQSAVEAFGVGWGQIESVFAGIPGFFTGLWENVKSIFSSVVQWVVDLFMNWTVYGLIIKHWDEIGAFFKFAWEAIKVVFGNAVQWVTSKVTGFLNGVRSAWSAGWSAVSSFFSNIWGRIVSAAGSFFGSVRSTFTSVINFVRDIPGRIVGFFSNLGGRLLASGRSLIQGFLDGIMAGFEKAKSFVSDGLGRIRDLFPFSPAKEGPFSGRGWVLYSGLSLGQTFTAAIADSISDGRDQIADEMDGIEDEFDRIEAYANGTEFSLRRAEPDLPDRDGTGRRPIEAPITVNASDPRVAARQVAEHLRGGSL